MTSFKRLASIALTVSCLSIAARATAETSDQVRDAQSMLARLGLYFGPVTGQRDRATIASFTTWLFSHRLPADTPLNVRTLKLMAKDLGDSGQPKATVAEGTKPGSQMPWFVILALSLVVPL